VQQKRTVHYATAQSYNDILKQQYYLSFILATLLFFVIAYFNPLPSAESFLSAVNKE